MKASWLIVMFLPPEIYSGESGICTSFNREQIGAWQLFTVPIGAGACVFSAAKQSGSQERKCTDKQRMLPRLEHILCFLNWGQAEVGVNRGAKIMRRWCQHFEPGSPNSEVTQGCYISSYISSLNFSSLLSCSHVFYLWNPQSCTLLSDQSYVVSSLIYSLWKGLDYKQ